MTLSADRDIGPLFGLNDALIGRIIGKTRQAVNHGFKSEQYLRPHEWILIVLFLKAQEHPSLDVLYEYIRKHFKNESKDIISGFGVLSADDDVTDWKNILAVVPDYRFFKLENPTGAQQVVDFFGSTKGTKCFVTSNSIDLQRFCGDVGIKLSASRAFARDDRAECYVIPEANQFPYMLICDIGSNHPRYFVYAAGKFRPMPKIRGQEIYDCLMPDIQREKERAGTETLLQEARLPVDKAAWPIADSQ